VVDSVNGTQQILGGRPLIPAFADGNTGTSRFNYPKGLCISVNEMTLYVCDSSNYRIRAIDTASGESRTVAGCGDWKNEDGIGTAVSIYNPRCCDWDRASDVEPFTFLYITAHYAVRRLNVKTGQMTTVKCSKFVDPTGIVCLSGSGLIFLSCIDTRCLWTIDQRSNTMKRLAGARTSDRSASPSTETEWDQPFSVHFDRPYGIAWHERDQCILVTDQSAHTVLRVPLPDHVFVKPPELVAVQPRTNI
jgi:hypothetical protein